MKIAILTDFVNWIDAYSPTHVVENQIRMLRRHGHNVVLFVREGFEDYKPLLLGARVFRAVPDYRPYDYATKDDLTGEHQQFAQQTARVLTKQLTEIDVAFTHDWIHTSWKLPLAEALRLSSEGTRHVQFLHWIHSRPCRPFDWWDIKRYGQNHKIVALNHTDRALVADAFRGETDDIHVIRNINDLRVLYRWTEHAWDFVDEYPALMSATFVQVYPVATDRLTDKGVNHLIGVLSAVKDRGFSVCLVIANGCTGVLPREDIIRYQRRAARSGLEPGTDFIFTSECAEFERGVPHDTLMDLMSCSSLFVFPSRGEADPLILPEAVLMSGALSVLNSSVPVMMEIGGGSGLYFHFGSADRENDCSKDYGWMADKIIAEFKEGIHSRTLYRQSLNMDRVYNDFYAPIFAELVGAKKMR